MGFTNGACQRNTHPGHATCSKSQDDTEQVNLSQRLLAVHQPKPNPVGHSGSAAIWFDSPIALPLLRPCAQFAIRRSGSFGFRFGNVFGQELEPFGPMSPVELELLWGVHDTAMRIQDSPQLLLPAHRDGLG